MQRILVSGASGFLGQVLCVQLAKKYQVISISRQNKSGEYAIQLDLASDFNLEILDNYAIDAIFHLAAESNVNSCEQFPKKSALINVRASKKLVQFAAIKNIPFVFTSSDQVFDGEKGNYKPTDEATPINEYGKQKKEAEKTVLGIYSSAVVCRLPLILGVNGGYEKAFIDNIKAGKKQTLFTDEIRSAEQVEVIAQKLIKALDFKGGIYHFGGPKALNRYEIGLMLAEKHGFDTALLLKGLQRDVNMLAARPSDVSLAQNV